MKKLLILLPLLALLPLITAQSLNIEFPNGDNFEAGEPITFKITLYDDGGKPIDGDIQVIIEDKENKAKTTKVMASKQVAIIDLGEQASSGQGIITARSGDAEAIAFFEIGRKELARFEIEGSTLKITNIGNTEYSRIVKITIGDTTGTQETNLDIGKSASYRLIAPDGNYNIKVTDGLTTISRGDIKLTGTGQAIGTIDESPAQRSGITGVTSPDEKSDIALLSYLQRNKFVYVFIAMIFAAMILIGIERRYKRKSTKK